GGRSLHVVDVSEPSAPRSAGTIDLPGEAGYLHPLPDDRALVIGGRTDKDDEDEQRPWAQAHLIDTSDADEPDLIDTWERPWSGDEVGLDHHAFTWWPERELALWGIHDLDWRSADEVPNHAVALEVDEELEDVALPEASQAPEEPAPCEVLPENERFERMFGTDSRVLHCEDPDLEDVEWSRWSCWRIEDEMSEQVAAGEDVG